MFQFPGAGVLVTMQISSAHGSGDSNNYLGRSMSTIP